MKLRTLLLLVFFSFVCTACGPRSVVFVDADNRPVELGNDPAHAPEGSGLITPRMLSTLDAPSLV